MKAHLFSLAACCLLLSACTNRPRQAAPATETAAPAKAKFPVHCFENRLPDGSVLSFQYTEYYDDIVGILDYSFADKDGAHGTFKGKKDGNLIAATWSYTVEGSEQTEEILFRIEGDKAMKASGELSESEDGKIRLKDPASASWDETYSRVQCD